MPEELLRLLENNPWLNLVFLALAVISVIVSIVFYVRSKKEKKPVFNKNSFNLVKNNVSKLEGMKITFMDTEIDNLTTTKVAIWNKGKETINIKDMASLDPIRILIDKKYIILQAKIIFTVNDVNNFSISLTDKNIININFDYFHTNEGIVIQLYHTGSSSDDIQILGTIKGVGNLKCGSIAEFELVDKYLGPIFDRIRPKKHTLCNIVNVLFIIVFFIPFTFLLSIDYIRRFFLTVPKCFKLEEL